MSNLVNVTQAITKLADSSTGDREVRVRNSGANPVALSKDGSGLTFANGFPLAAGAEDDFTLEAGEQLFAVAAAGLASNVEVL